MEEKYEIRFFMMFWTLKPHYFFYQLSLAIFAFGDYKIMLCVNLKGLDMLGETYHA